MLDRKQTRQLEASMPADLKNPFGESCCDGGSCNTEPLSTQYCGCDPGCKPKPYLCERHRYEAMIKELEVKCED